MLKRILIVGLLSAIVVAIPLGIFGKAYFEFMDIIGQKQTPISEQIRVDQIPLAHPVRAWHSVEDFDQNLAVLETVFWDPRDTESLRKLIREEGAFQDKSILEIGTGSGLLSLCCLQAGAEKVVATDVNPAAIENATYNSIRLGFEDRIDVRLVSLENPSAFAVIKAEEKFDFIISNPPWVNKKPETIDEFALYDENFALLKSLLECLPDHLQPDGRVLLAYGCVDAIKWIEQLADEYQLELIHHDARDLNELSAEFLPGYLVEIRRKTPEPTESPELESTK